MKKTIIENGIVHEIYYPPKSLPSQPNPCRYKGEFTHAYEVREDGSGKKYEVCSRCGNLPLK